MLSDNLDTLLARIAFGGASLNLTRKFAKQILQTLAFLGRTDVDIIHCDLKPDNILLRHPKKSGVKVADFGSSCRSNKRMCSYIQSRWYRSPEVILGLPYSTAIDMWSLGCTLFEVHTGEPLFSSYNQLEQMKKFVELLGMIPNSMLEKSSDSVKYQFFEKRKDQWILRQTKPFSSKPDASSPTSVVDDDTPIVPSTDPIASLMAKVKSAKLRPVVTGQHQRKEHSPFAIYDTKKNYDLFVDLLFKMLAYHPEDRIKPSEALEHPFLRITID